MPGAEPISLPFLLCFVALATLIVVETFAYQYAPGLDSPYHVFCLRVAVDWGTPGLLTDLYQPVQPYDANTLLYTVGALLARVLSPIRSFRILQLYWQLGVPIAALWALRRLGRSPWGSLLAFPLVYSEAYAVGLENFLFVSPTFLVTLVLFWEFLDRPRPTKGALIAALLCVVFVTHAHAFLLLGILLTVLTWWQMGRRFTLASVKGLRQAAWTALSTGLIALAVTVPSLGMFARWYKSTFGQNLTAAGSPLAATATAASAATASATAAADKFDPATYGAKYLPFFNKVTQGVLQAFITTEHPYELFFFVALILLILLALVARRRSDHERAAFVDICVILCVLSFFVLPDDISGQSVALRHLYVAGWLLPIVIVPPPTARAAMARTLVIGAICLFTGARMYVLWTCLDGFNRDEMAGFREILRHAPRDLRTLAYVAVTPKSKFYISNAFWHTYGYLAAVRHYEAPYNDFRAGSVSPVRYKDKAPLPIVHVYSDAEWPQRADVWQYDLVLVHGWHPLPPQRRAAEAAGTLVTLAGEWQLWRSNRAH